jgi:hypothetical protein
MNQPAVSPVTIVTFIVRFWRQTTAGRLRWRGSIEHVQSGRCTHFLGADGLLRSLHQFGIGTDSQPGYEIESTV